MEKSILFQTEIKKDNIIIYNAGKFNESKLKLNKIQAALLYIELHKFLELDK